MENMDTTLVCGEMPVIRTFKPLAETLDTA